MAILSFSLSAEATARVHDLLLCLAKFGESVCLEARNDKVEFTSDHPGASFSSPLTILAGYHGAELIPYRLRLILARPANLLSRI